MTAHIPPKSKPTGQPSASGLPPSAETLSGTPKNKIKIKPTGTGYLLIAILFAMLIASINYANNMAYALTFLLISLLLVSLLQTRSNITGLSITNVMPKPVFAGDRLHISLEIHNHTRTRKYGIWLSYDSPQGDPELSGPFTMGESSSTSGELSFMVSRRGSFVFREIMAITVYPMGLFLARNDMPINRSYLVYPKPEGTRVWPEPSGESETGGEDFQQLKGGDDFTGVRRYRVGESMHHVDWKAVARGRPLSIKEFTGGGAAHLYFDWTQLQGMGTETRLSQLCKWVLQADEQSTEYGLILPDTHIVPGSGSIHTLKCLEALAGYNERK